MNTYSISPSSKNIVKSSQSVWAVFSYTDTVKDTANSISSENITEILINSDPEKYLRNIVYHTSSVIETINNNENNNKINETACTWLAIEYINQTFEKNINTDRKDNSNKIWNENEMTKNNEKYNITQAIILANINTGQVNDLYTALQYYNNISNQDKKEIVSQIKAPEWSENDPRAAYSIALQDLSPEGLFNLFISQTQEFKVQDFCKFIDVVRYIQHDRTASMNNINIKPQNINSANKIIWEYDEKKSSEQANEMIANIEYDNETVEIMW